AQALVGGRLDIVEFGCGVLTISDRLGDGDADLLAVDIEGGNEIDVTGVIIPELHVHATRNFRPRGHMPVVLNTLDQGRGAVDQSGNRDSNRFRSHSSPLSFRVSPRRRAVRRAVSPSGAPCFRPRRSIIVIPSKTP